MPVSNCDGNFISRASILVRCRRIKPMRFELRSIWQIPDRPEGQKSGHAVFVGCRPVDFARSSRESDPSRSLLARRRLVRLLHGKSIKSRFEWRHQRRMSGEEEKETGFGECNPRLAVFFLAVSNLTCFGGAEMARAFNKNGTSRHGSSNKIIAALRALGEICWTILPNHTSGTTLWKETHQTKSHHVLEGTRN